ncbi:MAG: transposase [Burkholderiales bacterium]
MGRHSRLIVPEVALHVRQRGNNRQNTFRHDNDRLVYLSMLRECSRHRRCAVHAYCLMTNHVHLLLTASESEGCALLMRDLGRAYATYFNRRYGMSGALWQHPFRSCLVESADYVIACYRYIERNPVRARMVESPDAYPWSSYSGNAGIRIDELLTPHPEYLALGLERRTRLRAYGELVAGDDETEFVSQLREATDCGYALAGERLKAELEKDGARLGRAKAGRPAQRNAAAEREPGQLVLLTE